MKGALLKAAAKKMNYYKKKEPDFSDDDSNASLTSDDEDEVSVGYVNEVFNDKYVCIKYLGRGTFSRVWCVLDITNGNYYAMKTIFPKYYEDSLHEIEISRIIHSPTPAQNVINMVDNFIINKNGKKEMCIVTELLGTTLNDLFEENEHEYEDISDHETDEEFDSQEEDLSEETEETDEESRDSNNISDNDNDDNNSEADYNPPSLKLFKRIMIDILKGLEEMHRKNLVHTDLKFENIMIDILDENIKKVIENTNALNICEKYKNLINECLPENYSEFDKMKKKKVKRKAKVKAANLLRNFMQENNKPIQNVESNNEIKRLKLCDLENIENFKFKVIDLGNTEKMNDKVQDEIMVRNYRPPENIIGEYYDTKADMWCLGCLAYELLTGRYLFDVPKVKKSLDRDRKHLHQMYEILGKMPKDYTQNCDFSEDLFDSKGRVLKNKNCIYTDLEKMLNDESKYSSEEINGLSVFLKKLLQYNLKERYSSSDALKDSWLLGN